MKPTLVTHVLSYTRASVFFFFIVLNWSETCCPKVSQKTKLKEQDNFVFYCTGKASEGKTGYTINVHYGLKRASEEQTEVFH